MKYMVNSALKRTVQEKQLVELVNKTAVKRKIWAKRIQPFEVIEGNVFFEKHFFPSCDDVNRLLRLVHEKGLHAIIMPTLRQLKKNAFTLPKFTGGWERACIL